MWWFLLRAVCAHLLVFNGTFHTMSPWHPKAHSLCIDEQGLILSVDQPCPFAQRVLDLQGNTVVPGLIDSHAHLLEQGWKLSRPQLQDADSVERVLEVLQEWIESHGTAQGWLLGFGWDQNKWKNKNYPDRVILDKLFPGIKILLTRIDGHAVWVNSAVLALIQVPSSVPGGAIERRDDGSPSGIFADNAIDLVNAVIPSPSDTEIENALEKSIALCVQNGLTAIHDAGVPPNVIRVYMNMIDKGKFPIRNYAMRLNTTDEPTAPQLERYGGKLTVRAVKFFMDGALGSWLALSS